MFWGRGDSSELTDKEREVLAALRRLEETGHIVGTPPEDTKKALAAIAFYSAISATSGVLVGARNVGYWIAGLLVLWWTSKDQLIAFIKKAIGV